MATGTNKSVPRRLLHSPSRVCSAPTNCWTALALRTSSAWAACIRSSTSGRLASSSETVPSLTIRSCSSLLRNASLRNSVRSGRLPILIRFTPA